MWVCVLSSSSYRLLRSTRRGGVAPTTGRGPANPLNDLTAGPDQSIKNFAAGATENAANNSRQLALTLRSLGFQDGATQGATQGQFQNAATQTNQFATQQMSPEHIQSVIQALLASLQGGSQLFGGNAAQAAQGVYGQPQVQVQPNYLANALGQAAGAYAGKH